MLDKLSWSSITKRLSRGCLYFMGTSYSSEVENMAGKSEDDVHNPNKAWSKMMVKQVVNKVTPIDPSTPKPDGYTRFVCISDTHSKTKMLQVPEGDVLLHGGDFTKIGHYREVAEFRDFLLSLPHQHKVVIAGNHDITFDSESYPGMYVRFGHKEPYNCQEIKDLIINAVGVTYLEDTGCTINGIKIWGSPWQPVFCDWGFNIERGDPIQKKWDMIPDDTDILITHGPPIGHGDLCYHGGRAGCVNLLRTIQSRIKPKYHVFGHIHEGYGMTTDGVTTYINASTCNLKYQPFQNPIIFDLPNK